MKNLNHLTSLLLMLALALTPAIALSETWDQKLDLTIPSLEMPSILPLDSKAKQEIMMGWTCCYPNSVVKQVQKEHSEKLIALRLKANQNQLQFTLTEPISNAKWATFTILQLADIYTTYKGLQYNCVMETNPLFGESPSLSRMFFTKAAILGPAIEYDIENGNVTPQILDQMNIMMSFVVINNYNVYEKAKRNCIKKS